MENKTKNTSLTIGNTIYKTGGNIVFSDTNPDDYYVAESRVLDNWDRLLRRGILENGMQSLLKKLRP